MAQAKPESTEPKAASSSAIIQALAPYKTNGPSGLEVRIGTKEITLKREQRKFTAPRDADIDALVDAAVDMSGPITPNEIENTFEPYKAKGVTMKIEDGAVYFTRKPHIVSMRTGEGKIKQVQMKERTVSSSLDVPMAHIIGVLKELANEKVEMFE